MRKWWMIAVTAVLSLLVAACGGGGSSGSNSVITLVDIADCFQIKPANSMRYASTASPAQATTPQLPGVNSSTTYYYESTVADIKYEPGLVGTTLVMTRISSGTETFGSSSGPVTRSFVDTEVLSTTPSFTLVRSSESRPSITYVSATNYAGNVRPLAVATGQPHHFSFSATKTSSISGEAATTTVSVTSQTVTFLAREDVVTSAGTFKNSCKFNSDTKLVQSSTPGASVTAIVTAGVNSTQWFAPGWGLVRQDSTERFTDGRQPAILTRTSGATAILSGSL